MLIFTDSIRLIRREGRARITALIALSCENQRISFACLYLLTHANYWLLGNCISKTTCSEDLCYHRPIKHYKTTTLTKDDKKLKTLAGTTGDSISTTN
jgi:hypothetical protein